MPDHKRHHYVPQMYMRLFCRDGDSRIGVYAIDSGKFIPNAPIRGQACRDYFYGRDPQVERAFGTLEGNAARIFADARRALRLPPFGSEDHEWLIFYLGIQSARTIAAAEQLNEAAEKVAKSMLRQKAELEGDSVVLAALDRVRIKGSNLVGELVGQATIAASLLTDLRFVLVDNQTDIPFLASDAPVVLHNRHFEEQPISVIGYANVGLQIFLPLGPRLLLFGYDAAAYAVQTDEQGIVRLHHSTATSLLNDLQWEAAHAVLLTSPDMPEDKLRCSAARWATPRLRERTIVREQMVERLPSEVRIRHGSGAVPSTVALDLPFAACRLARPQKLAAWELPPVRDPERAARVQHAFERLETLRTRDG